MAEFKFWIDDTIEQMEEEKNFWIRDSEGIFFVGR
jgi:hypothetical protein